MLVDGERLYNLLLDQCAVCHASAEGFRGRYLLRTNLVEEDPAKLWSHYLLLVAVEEAFKNLKGDLAIRPIFHQLEARVEAHVFIAFLAYCLHVTLARRLHALAPGLTPRSVLEKFAAVQMIDVHMPTTDGRELLLTRYTEPGVYAAATGSIRLESLFLTLPTRALKHRTDPALSGRGIPPGRWTNATDHRGPPGDTKACPRFATAAGIGGKNRLAPGRRPEALPEQPAAPSRPVPITGHTDECCSASW
jgi:hypothetical protein